MAINNFVYSQETVFFVRNCLFQALSKIFTPVKMQFNTNKFSPGIQIKRQIVCSIG